MKKLDGVETADVSLNEGRVTVRLVPENDLTIAQLRRTIRDQGFSPRDAVLTLSAVIETREGAVVAIVPGSGVVYTLAADEVILARLAGAAGATVVVQGRLDADQNDEAPTSLVVTNVVGG